MSEEDTTTLVDILDVIVGHYGVSKIDLRSHRRTGDLIEPRHVAFYLGAKSTPHSLPSIGAYMRRDHTTVLHGRDKIASAILIDSDLAERVEAIKMASIAMTHLRRERRVEFEPALTPLDLARRISSSGARAACAVSIDEILEISEALLDAHVPPAALAVEDAPDREFDARSSRRAIVKFLARQADYRASPTEQSRMMRDHAIEPLRDRRRQNHPFVSDIVSAYDFMIRSEFTAAEKEATRKFVSLLLRVTAAVDEQETGETE